MGGFAHLATLVKRMKASRPQALLLNGGDSWQGSATALWTAGQDMVEASLELGVDVMTGHWEFTHGAERVLQVVRNDFKDKLAFIAQNIVHEDSDAPVFDAYVMREQNGIPVAIIGQAFPCTPKANGAQFTPDWAVGIDEARLQAMVNAVRAKGAQVVVLLRYGYRPQTGGAHFQDRHDIGRTYPRRRAGAQRGQKPRRGNRRHQRRIPR
ncbi:MAG TPA: hypothetical protein PLE48_12305 [Thiobacillus sp.]|nr:MAG: hypothetical protein B7Y50_11170 [Hydrogenophilales bacterium 28-61-11]OYZ59074.1 MAG: hypothetical protein B7Y21_00555 [Hydrogenophilales bacterium 16-61-112]OZA51104.1 MAG: hypothetical protein B7X81_00200 [Hydrogenophilales bacterium 17-61-76]HQT30846.1 hypothetical protein [Thiobacillus sp.]HQT71192.1 hypothetical protein [Thiobacillus sp.]